nr:hypothetical protein [Saccharopolyspora gloriosae]
MLAGAEPVEHVGDQQFRIGFEDLDEQRVFPRGRGGAHDPVDAVLARPVAGVGGQQRDEFAGEQIRGQGSHVRPPPVDRRAAHPGSAGDLRERGATHADREHALLRRVEDRIVVTT